MKRPTKHTEHTKMKTKKQSRKKAQKAQGAKTPRPKAWAKVDREEVAAETAEREITALRAAILRGQRAIATTLATLGFQTQKQAARSLELHRQMRRAELVGVGP